MITSIVRGVQARLQASHRDDVAVAIVFPVAAEAITQTDDPLGIVPGASGEGCSVAGGCATCPYMRMNHLDGLIDVVRKIGSNAADLTAFLPAASPPDASGHSVAERGTVPILHMRAFQHTGRMPDALVAAVTGHAAALA